MSLFLSVAWSAMVLGAYFLPPLWRQGLGAFTSGVDIGMPVPSLLWPAFAGAVTALGGAAACLLAALSIGMGIGQVMRLRLASVGEVAFIGIPLGVGALANLGLLLAAMGLYTPLTLRLIIMAGMVMTCRRRKSAGSRWSIARVSR